MANFYPLGPVQDWWGKLKDWIEWQEEKYFMPPVTGGLSQYYLGDKTQTTPLPPQLVDAIIQGSALRNDEYSNVDHSIAKPMPSTQQGRDDLWNWMIQLLLGNTHQVDPYTFRYNTHKFLYDHPEWNPVEWETFTDPDNKRVNPEWDPQFPYGNYQGNQQWLYNYIPNETARSKKWWSEHTGHGSSFWNDAFWAAFDAEWDVYDFFKGFFEPGLWEDLLLLGGPLIGIIIFASFRTSAPQYSYY
jgi:hypothetical protein